MAAFSEPHVANDDLDSLLANRIEAARSELLRANGRIDTAEIEEIERLARFITLRKDLERPKRPARTVVAGTLIGTLVAVSLLMYVRLPETELEVLATTSQVGFRLQAPQPFSDGMEAEDLLVTCACDIRVPAGPNQAARVVSANGGNATVRVTVAGSGERRGSITVAPIALGADSLVRLRHRGTAGRYVLSLEAPQLVLRVNLYGSILLAVPGDTPATIDFVVPKAMLAPAGGKALTLDIQTSDTGGLGLAPQLLVNDVAFLRIDETAEPGQPVRRVSTITGGTIYWEALNGKERPLRPSEQIDFDGVRGEIVSIDLKQAEMALRFHGEVADVTAGRGNNRRSLMPTWLEWLRARHGLSLLWGSTVYIVGLVLAALRWFKVTA